MKKPKTQKRSWRLRKAYTTFFVVASRYGWLHLKAKIFGQKYYESRLFDLHVKNAHYVKNNILKLQGLFVKVGQLLSILTNILPEPFHEPLEALQDQIPERPYDQISRRIKEELGKAPEELFKSFEKHPIAAASIGQAHRAVLLDGTPVVVKVQHDQIQAVAEVDLEIIERITRLVGRFFNIVGIDYAYGQVKKMIEDELDFRKEGMSMKIIGANLAKEPLVKVPVMQEEYSTKRILTTTFCEGVKINQNAQLEDWGIDKEELADRLVGLYCHMVFKDGFYHADPHPGNILVQQDGTIVLLDFGAVAVIDDELRSGIPELIEATLRNDGDAMIDLLRKMGFLDESEQSKVIAQKMIIAIRKFLEQEVKLDGLNFRDIEIKPFDNSLFDLTKEIGIKDLASTVQMPKDYVLLNRMVTLLVGICGNLNPKMNPIEVVRPYLKEFLVGEKGDWVAFVKNIFQGTFTSLFALPNEINKTLKSVQRGDVKVKTPGYNERSRMFLNLGIAFIYMILSIALFTLFWFGSSPKSEYFSYLAGFIFILAFRRIGKATQAIKNLE